MENLTNNFVCAAVYTGNVALTTICGYAGDTIFDEGMRGRIFGRFLCNLKYQLVQSHFLPQHAGAYILLRQSRS